MNPTLLAGTIIVHLALISYTLFIINEHKHKKATGKTLFFLTAGIILDITATVCMIIGSPNSPFTIHGFVGYSSLTGMLIDTILIWKHKSNKGADVAISDKLNLYTKIAYCWWLVAFITGAVIVITKPA
jgi:uncharacterized membrane protein